VALLLGTLPVTDNEILAWWHDKLRAAIEGTAPPIPCAPRPCVWNAVKPLVRIPPTGLDWEDLEREAYATALGMTEGHQKEAAVLLGLTARAFCYRLQQLGLNKTALAQKAQAGEE
jgi:transcriptional regulator with GAF, ATPase, and Fis domain